PPKDPFPPEWDEDPPEEETTWWDGVVDWFKDLFGDDDGDGGSQQTPVDGDEPRGGSDPSDFDEEEDLQI
ncbi:MAG: hypothetical protein D6744_09550, partial [Planctomycetota bacterium]